MWISHTNSNDPNTSAPRSAPAQLQTEPAPTPKAPGDIREGRSNQGICGRTPEVQTNIIRTLNRDDSGLSCESIRADQLHRLRKLDINTPHLRRKDLYHLSSLTKLRITGLTAPLEPKTFTYQVQLQTLEIHSQVDPTSREKLIGQNELDSLAITITDPANAVSLAADFWPPPRKSPG